MHNLGQVQCGTLTKDFQLLQNDAINEIHFFFNKRRDTEKRNEIHWGICILSMQCEKMRVQSCGKAEILIYQEA